MLCKEYFLAFEAFNFDVTNLLSLCYRSCTPPLPADTLSDDLEEVSAIEPQHTYKYQRSLSASAKMLSRGTEFHRR